MLDKLREELHYLIATYGTLDERTIAKSQELDIFITEEMLKQVRR